MSFELINFYNELITIKLYSLHTLALAHSECSPNILQE